MGDGLAERSHLSIGEVLSLLRDEFPDVTISKIRFLESQGLVDPERTPSGYRKFYDQDVERLRWILRQQREHYMPLKVIRSRLTDRPATDGGQAPEPTAEEAQTQVATVVGVDLAPEESARRPLPATPSLFAGLHPLGEDEPAPAPPDAPEPPHAAVAPPPSPPGRSRERRAAPAPARPAPEPVATAVDPDTYTPEELAEAAGTDLALVGELKQYGLISPHAAVAGTQYYDDGALAVTRAAAEFARHGVEARHLRIWRNAADRESDLLQQVVLPLLRQRNPQARRQALDTLAELSQAGADLRAALVERAVRDIR